MEELKILFVCSRNKKRSLTAEKIFKGRPGLHAKSAGTADGARIKVSEELLNWADQVWVMEKNHKTVIRQSFPEFDQSKIVVLGISDDYEFLDSELIEILEGCLADLLP